MSEPSDDWGKMRRLVLGLGDESTHKSHYPGLRQRLAELERFRSMIDLSGDMLFVLDATDGILLTVNATACEKLGRTESQLLGTAFAELLPAAARNELATFLGGFERCMAMPATLSCDLPSGEGGYFATEITMRCGSAGGKRYAVLAARDITERKRIEAHLRQNAMVFSSTHEGVIITDGNGDILAVNPAFTAISGYTEEEIVGCNPRILKSERHGEEFYRAMWHDITTTDVWQGEIWNRRKNGEVYPEFLTISVVRDDSGNISNYVGVFTDISRIKHSESQLEHLAYHDALTSLPNRQLFVSRLSHAVGYGRRHSAKGAVLYIDLDRFKNINESLGHTVGDELLQVVALRLRERLRDSDTMARLGGDEFVVLLEDIVFPGDAADIAQDLIERMRAPIILSDGHEVYVSASIGISLYPEDGDNAEGLIQNADAALYQAKAGGRNTFRFYTEELTRAANERLELEAALRRALENDEFILHYQPLVSLADSRINGLEALVRWREPSGNLVPPARFIPVAEETGLIVPLGEWVLREACTQVRTWLDSGLDIATIAVNLSPLQFRQPELGRLIGDILEETALPANFLELEITEGAIMDLGAATGATFAELRQLGVRVAIDDFGTGYSSMAYLKHFAVDKLKIDQSFVREIPYASSDAAIVTTIIAMAKNLKMEALAEGVETEAQYRFLKENGCNTGQGYFFSHPLPAEQILQLLHRDIAGIE